MVEFKDIRVVDTTSYPYIFEQNATVPLKNGGVIRCNVYRPKDTEQGQKYPVIATHGPYGKDVPYSKYVICPLLGTPQKKERKKIISNKIPTYLPTYQL